MTFEKIFIKLCRTDDYYPTEDELPVDAQVLANESGGVVYLEYRTCGDGNCSCMSGGEKHGPYKYRAYRDGDTV